MGIFERLRGLGDQRGAVQAGGLLALAGVAIGGVGVGFAGQRLLIDEARPATAGASREVVEVDAHDCPDGTVVGALRSGDQVWVTARSEDGSWLRVRNPLASDERWWIQGDGLEASGDVEGLPVADCADDLTEADSGSSDPEAPDRSGEPSADAEPDVTSTSVPDDELALPSLPEDPVTGIVVVPGEPAPISPPGNPDGPSTSPPPTSPPQTTRPTTTTRPTPTTRPAPTPQPPTTSPPPTSPPDRTGPSLTAWLGTTELWEADSQHIMCGSKPRSTTVSASVSDPSGVASVVATWQVGNHNGNVTLTGGATRTGTVGPHAYRTVPSQADQPVTVTVTATDNEGNQSVTTTTFTLHSTDWCFG